MNDEAEALHSAAVAAHERGDHDEAVAILRKILELHSLSPSAAEAIYYLSMGKRAGPARSRAPRAGDCLKAQRK
jgi:hypothetical protein